MSRLHFSYFCTGQETIDECDFVKQFVCNCLRKKMKWWTTMIRSYYNHVRQRRTRYPNHRYFLAPYARYSILIIISLPTRDLLFSLSSIELYGIDTHPRRRSNIYGINTTSPVPAEAGSIIYLNLWRISFSHHVLLGGSFIIKVIDRHLPNS